MGYLTAYNTLAADTYDALGGKSLEEALAWLAAYCADHRLDSFDRAVTQLIIAHHERRARGTGTGSGVRDGWGREPGRDAP